MSHLSPLFVVVIAVLLIDAGFELRDGDYWGAVRTLAIVALLPYVLRSRGPKR